MKVLACLLCWGSVHTAGIRLAFLVPGLLPIDIDRHFHELFVRFGYTVF